jgi:hypothetical protein
MANIFPLLSETKEETITLEIDAADTSATHSHVVNSRTLKIDAQGATNACTHTVNISGPNGLVFLIDFLDSGSLNANSAATAASSVTIAKGENTILLDLVTEQASVMLTENGFIDASDMLLIGATTGATFA